MAATGVAVGGVRVAEGCHYYGHTKQWCPVKKARDEREAERVLEEDRAYFEKHGTVLDRSTLTLADYIAEDPVAGESRWRWKQRLGSECGPFLNSSIINNPLSWSWQTGHLSL